MKTRLLTLFVSHLSLAVVLAQPVITDQPQNQTAIAGSTVTFTVTAIGFEPLTYQWRKYSADGRCAEIPGATNLTLTLSNVQFTSDTFAVMVTDVDGLSVVSEPWARLTVLGPPQLLSEPSRPTAVEGESYELKAGAVGTEPLTYRWYFKGDLLSDATSDTLTFDPVQPSDAGEYSVAVENFYGSVSNRVAMLAVVPPTEFTRVTNGPIAADLGANTGSAWADFNGDGFLDLYVTQIYRGTNSYFLNNRDGTFTQVTHGDFLVNDIVPINEPGSLGISVADYDNDGHLDLVMGNCCGSMPRRVNLLHNNGDGTFARASGGGVTNQLGYFPVMQWADYDNDGFVDLLVTDLGTIDSQGGTNQLWHNHGDGTFTRVNSSSIVTDVMAGWDALWSDYDNDGKTDLFLINYANGQNYLYHNGGYGTFARVLDNPIATDMYSQGITAADWGDYDNDGLLDLFVPDGGNRNDHLYHNNGGGAFSDVGVGPMLIHPSGSSGRSGAWGDYDNDGYLDLFVGYLDHNSLYRNNHDGTFSEVRSFAPASDTLSYPNFFNGPTWVDYDNDGFLDLHIGGGNTADPPIRTPSFLYHNDGNTNAWIEVKCIGTVANRAAIGAKIRVKATIDGKNVWQMRELSSGGGWNLGKPLVAHFGLGDAGHVDTLRIEWPSGTVQELANVAPKQILTLIEPPRLNVTQVGVQPEFTLKGGRFMTYDIQTSTNLADWSPGTSVTITNFDGIIPISIPMPPDGPQKFYRAVLR